jgi:hypothetical protein
MSSTYKPNKAVDEGILLLSDTYFPKLWAVDCIECWNVVLPVFLGKVGSKYAVSEQLVLLKSILFLQNCLHNRG